MVKEAKLLTVREGYYTMYVFKLLEENSFLMCTKLPNWQTPEIDIGDEGYLHYEIIKAGDKYFNPATNNYETYRYDNLYFINFIKKSVVTNNNIIL